MNGNKETYRPEDDIQELWMLNGRVEALHGVIMKELEDSSSSNPIIYCKDICAIMGWKYEQ